MAQRHSPPSTEQHPENLPHIGFDLFPPKAAAPATRPAPAAPIAPPALASPPALPATHRKPPAIPRDLDSDRYTPQLSFWNRSSSWFRPLIFLLLGWAIFNTKFLFIGGTPLVLVGQFGLALFLLYRAFIAAIVCFLGMKITGDDIDSFPTFLFHIFSAVTFTGSLVFVLPPLGPWLIDPLILWVLFCWFLEVSPVTGFLLSLATCAISWLMILFFLMSLLTRFHGS